MLSSEVSQKELMVKRIEQVVSTLMEEESIYKEDFDYRDVVEHLSHFFNSNLSSDKFNLMSYEQLKERCDRLMSIKLLAKIGENFTPEEMAIFEDAIKRK